MKKYIITIVMAALVSVSAFGSMRSSDHAKRQAQINAEIEEHNKRLVEKTANELNLQLKTILASDAQTKTINAQTDAIKNFQKNLEDCDQRHKVCSENLSDKNEKLLASEKNVTKFETEFNNCKDQLNTANINLRNQKEEIKTLNDDVFNAQLSAQRASDLLKNSHKIAMDELLVKAITLIIENDLIKSQKTYENQTCTSDKNQHIQDIFNEVLVLLTAEKNSTSN